MGEREAFSISDSDAGSDATVVCVTGEIDMETGPSFQRGLLHAIGAGRGGLVIDLSRASFMDSSALTSLVNTFDQLRQSGTGLAIVAGDARVRSIFDVARLARDFQIFETRRDALEALGALADAAEADEAARGEHAQADAAEAQ
jgi:anti-sigma B factor antagonist